MRGQQTGPPYNLEEFSQKPGIYFEKIGRLHPVQTWWKLVIKIDISSLMRRAEQLRGSIQRTESLCESILTHTRTCQNFYMIIAKRYDKIQLLIDRIQIVYGTEMNKRRGLFNGLGSIAKTLFGTMDADDDKLISEQLMLLHNANAVTQHALKNQIKVINSTIAHVDNIESTIEQNEKTLLELIKQIQSTIVIHNRRNDLDEHFTIIDAMISDLTRDAIETLEYLMNIKQGFLHPKLTPIDNIINNLREAAAGLPKGLYFPFTCQKQEWLNIEKVTTTTAYRDKENIYSILKFPLATLPMYEILHAISLPVYDHDDVFTAVEIRNRWIAVDNDRQGGSR